MLYYVYEGNGEEMIDVLDLDKTQKEAYEKNNPKHTLVADKDMPLGGDLYDEWK